MAVCNLSGSILGSRMALRHGTGFVRKMFPCSGGGAGSFALPTIPSCADGVFHVEQPRVRDAPRVWMGAI